jgi:glycosyltransferase involved in cell wall biosynthesis
VVNTQLQLLEAQDAAADPSMQTSLRVLHWPTMTGGNPQSLARAERALGVVSRSVVMAANYLNYATDEILLNGRSDPLTREWQRLRMLWRGMREFDVLHFNNGHSLTPVCSPIIHEGTSRYPAALNRLYRAYARLIELRDLPLLERLGKGIVVTFQGDDARQGDYCREHFDISFVNEVEPGYYSDEDDAHKRYRIGQFARYADRIFALNPDLLRVLPSQARFLPYANVDIRDWTPLPARETREVPLVVHAPSHRGVKGTRFVLDAVSRLQAEGVAFEFALVEGMSNAEARRLYEQADLLIDQLLAGWYGGLAVELMALGKPVLCYIREEDLQFIPHGMRAQLPIINVNPATLYGVLRESLTQRKGELAAEGRRGREYVESWHDPLRIAAMLKQEYLEILQTKRQGSR